MCRQMELWRRLYGTMYDDLGGKQIPVIAETKD